MKSLLVLTIFAFLITGIAIAQNSAQDKKEDKSGIKGKVLLGPKKNLAKPGDQEFEPFETTLVVKTEDGAKEVTQIKSKSNGRFRIQLEPGTYTVNLQTDGAKYPRCEDTKVKVEPHQFTKVIIKCDTGIR